MEEANEALKKENAQLREEIERLKEKIRQYIAVLSLRSN